MTAKNGNLPAMPQTNADNLCMQTGTAKAEHAGLSKREMFAMAAMQGILANSSNLMSYAARDAVLMADELLTQLEATK